MRKTYLFSMLSMLLFISVFFTSCSSSEANLQMSEQPELTTPAPTPETSEVPPSPEAIETAKPSVSPSSVPTTTLSTELTTPTPNPEATETVEPSLSPSPDPAPSIEWDSSIEIVKEDLMNSDSFSYVYDIDIQIDEDNKEIQFMVIMEDYTDPETALDFGDTIIRRLSSTVHIENEVTYAAPSKETYGGLYDTYSIMLAISPLSQVNSSSDWYVYQYISKGTHQAVRLQ